MIFRTFRLFLLLETVAPTTKAKTDCPIIFTRSSRQGVATISGLRYTQPTHEPIDLSDVDRDAIKALIL